MPKKNKYRSRFEAETANTLDTLKVDYTYEEERLSYLVEHHYTPDFLIRKKDNEIMYVETKGYFSPKDRTKTLEILKTYPEIDLRFIFCCASNKLSSGSGTTYADWCNKRGIPWAEETLPDEWLKECKRRPKPQPKKRRRGKNG